MVGMARSPRLAAHRLSALFISLALIAAACSDSDGGASTSTPTGTAAAPSSTGASADGEGGGASTTTVASTTTSVVSTTGDTTAAPVTADPAEPRPDGLVLLGDGLGPLRFGATPETAIEFLNASLGTPMADSGWTDSFSVYGTCPGTEVRGVEWPGFLALFGDADDGYSDGERHFMSWTAGWFGPDPFGMSTEVGLAIGDSRDEIAGLYLAATFNPADGPFSPSVHIPTDRGDLTGFFGEDGRSLETLTAGTVCGE